MKIKLISLFALALLLASCATLPAAEQQPTSPAAAERPTIAPSEVPQQEAAPSAVIDEAALANMTYRSEWTDSGEAALVEGEFRAPADSGAGEKLIVLDRAHIAYGQVAEADSAAVVLTNGAFYELALVRAQEDGSLAHTNSISLGEGVQVKSLSIDEEGAIVAEMMTRGPLDPACCPSRLVIQTYRLEEGALVLMSSEAAGGIQPQEAPGLAEGVNPAAPAAPAGLELEALLNMTYRSEWVEGGEAALVDGELRQPAASGAVSETVITLDQQHIAYGKIEGKDAAAFILATQTGGTGVFYNLGVAALLDDGTPIHLADVFLGDRVQINKLQIDETGEIVVDLITHGPQDPMCCPTQQTTQRYTLDGKTLNLAGEQKDAQPAPAAGELVGFVWVWTDFQAGDGSVVSATDPSQYTLRFRADGTFDIQADCNRGSGSYTLEGSSLAMQVGPLTKVLCVPESLSEDFIEYLEAAASYRIDEQGLHIALKLDGGVMNFAVLSP